MPKNPYAGAAKRVTPKSMRKREAPAQQIPIRLDRRRQDRRYGIPKTYRLPGEFIAMLELAGEKWGVVPREFIQLAVSDYIRALENGKVELPIEEEKRKRTLRLPEIPQVRVD